MANKFCMNRVIYLTDIEKFSSVWPSTSLLLLIFHLYPVVISFLIFLRLSAQIKIGDPSFHLLHQEVYGTLAVPFDVTTLNRLSADYRFLLS